MAKYSKKPMNIINENSPSYEKEAYRYLRTNVRFLCPSDDSKVVCVTSSIKNEGKSTVALNLATSIERNNERVLFIDANLREDSNMWERLGLKNNVGLSNILQSTSDVFSATQKMKDFPSLYIITSGKKVNNSSELLSSDKMASLIEECREKYDYVIIDTPAVGIVSDALVLSPYIDGYVIVVKSKCVRNRVLRKTVEEIKRIDGNILGFSLTNAKPKKRA